MKYLKTYNKLFESQDFTWFSDLFLELNHEGRFKITVSESNTQKLDFSNSDVIDIHHMETPPGGMIVIKTINVKVEKRELDESGQLTLNQFNIDDVKETLRFAESYAKDELGLEIEYIYVMRIPKYMYYKSVDALPNNEMVDSVTFAFRKID